MIARSAAAAGVHSARILPSARTRLFAFGIDLIPRTCAARAPAGG